jgi:hypothetical protein
MIPIPGLFVVAVTTLMLTGGPVSEKNPEPLTGAYDPEQVLVNLEQRIKDRDWKRYGDFLAPEFRFTPYSGVYQEIPPVPWYLWERDWEIQFIEKLVSPAKGGASLSLLKKILNKGLESRSRAEWDLVYTLSARGQTFSSRAIFVFVKVDNLWYLREWIDTSLETDEKTGEFLQTSGSLRGVVFQE